MIVPLDMCSGPAHRRFAVHVDLQLLFQARLEDARVVANHSMDNGIAFTSKMSRATKIILACSIRVQSLGFAKIQTNIQPWKRSTTPSATEIDLQVD